MQGENRGKGKNNWLGNNNENWANPRETMAVAQSHKYVKARPERPERMWLRLPQPHKSEQRQTYPRVTATPPRHVLVNDSRLFSPESSQINEEPTGSWVQVLALTPHATQQRRGWQNRALRKSRADEQKTHTNGVLPRKTGLLARGRSLGDSDQ